MTAVGFCDNRYDMAIRGIRVPAGTLVPGDYLLHTRRLVEAVEEDGDRLVVTTRVGLQTYRQRWLPSTPVIIAPRSEGAVEGP